MTDQPVTTSSFLEQTEMGIGTWAWGDRLLWGYGGSYQENDLRAAFLSAYEKGVKFFDTAETYGQGKSECLLGDFKTEINDNVRIATKFMPYPWRLNRQSLARALKGSLKRLKVPYIDLYQLHMPLPPITIETWMEAMGESFQSGLIKGVGISNFNSVQTERAHDALIRQGIRLVSNQIEFHLLNRTVEKNGVMALCKSFGMQIISYSPLAQGLLTGKYGPENPPGGFRGGRFNKKYLAQIQPLIQAMKRVGSEHDGKTAAQVAINWVICKGTIPIPGAKTVEQMEQNLGAVGWRLSADEVEYLGDISDRVTRD